MRSARRLLRIAPAVEIDEAAAAAGVSVKGLRASLRRVPVRGGCAAAAAGVVSKLGHAADPAAAAAAASHAACPPPVLRAVPAVYDSSPGAVQSATAASVEAGGTARWALRGSYWEQSFYRWLEHRGPLIS